MESKTPPPRKLHIDKPPTIDFTYATLLLSEETPKTPVTVNSKEQTTLHEAVLTSDLERVRKELGKVGKNCRDILEDKAENGDLSLTGRLRLRTLLLAQEEHGFSALMNAAALDDPKKSRDIVELILSSASRAENISIPLAMTFGSPGEPAMPEIDKEEHSEKRTCLHDMIELCDSDGYTCMHWAAVCNNPETVELLVRHGANPNTPGSDGESPLHRACRFGAKKGTLALLRCGANECARNENYGTPLDVAGMMGKKVDRDVRDAIREIILKERPKSKLMLVYHQDCLMHESHQINHQESPERVREVLKLLQEGRFMNWASSEIRWAKDFPLATPRQALRVHTRKYLELVELLSRQASISGRAMPFTPHVQKVIGHVPDSKVKQAQYCDTSLSPGSRQAALRAAGAVVYSVDRIMDGCTTSAFCLVRPPGHHAGPSGLEGAPSCGFCIFNSVAIGAAHALRVYGYRQNEQDRCCRRVAILDFDIHHGNGTEAIVKRLAKQYPNQIFFCSIHLYDHSSNSRYSFYPGTGKNDNMESNIVNIALPPMWHNASLVSSSPSGLPPPPSVPSGRRAFRKEIMSRLIPALRAFSPDLIMISAGFDGGRGDIGNQKIGSAILQQGMDLNVQDYSWLTEKIRDVAKVCCDGRIISVLEGGYGCQNQACRKSSSSSQSRKPRSSSQSSTTTTTTSRRGKRKRRAPKHLSPPLSPNDEESSKRQKNSNGEIASTKNSSSTTIVDIDVKSLSKSKSLPADSADSADSTSSSEEKKVVDDKNSKPQPQLDRSRFALNVVSHIRALAGAIS